MPRDAPQAEGNLEPQTCPPLDSSEGTVFFPGWGWIKALLPLPGFQTRLVGKWIFMENTFFGPRYISFGPGHFYWTLLQFFWRWLPFF